MRDEAPANERHYRLKFDKMVENSLDVLRLCCMTFCGPVILTETLLTLIYYSRIVDRSHCPISADNFTNVLVYVLIIAILISLAVTAFCCYSIYLFGKTCRDVWPQIRNPPPPPEIDDARSIVSNEDVDHRLSARERLRQLRYSESQQFRNLRASIEQEDRIMQEVE